MFRKALAIAAVSLVALSAPAMAGVIISGVTQGSAASFAGGAGTLVDFESGVPAGFTLSGAVATGPSTGTGAQPAFATLGTANHYVVANNGAPVTLSSATAYDAVSIFWGSVDQYNTLEFYNAANQLIGSISGSNAALQPANGDQFLPSTNLRVAFATTGGDHISTLKFVNDAQPAFEADNVIFSSAVPEPATWAMMIVGFGAIGGALRGSRRQTPLATA